MDIDRAVAYHEAGHAIIGCIFKQPFKLVTIEPKKPETCLIESSDCEPMEAIIDTGYCGCVEFENEEIIDSILAMGDHWLRNHPEQIDYVRGAILSAMAGSIAQEIGAPGTSLMSAEDMKSANWMLGCLYKENNLAEMEKARHEVVAILKEKWCLVEKVVEALLERRTISGEDCLHLIQS
jgi:hypothetical protein